MPEYQKANLNAIFSDTHILNKHLEDILPANYGILKISVKPRDPSLMDYYDFECGQLVANVAELWYAIARWEGTFLLPPTLFTKYLTYQPAGNMKFTPRDLLKNAPRFHCFLLPLRCHRKF